MLDYYIEKNIQNKLELLNIFYADRNITMTDLQISFPLSLTGINTLIDELNMDFIGLAEIKKQSSYFSLVIYSGTSFMEMLHAIYQTSDVLHCLKFMVLNDENHAFTEFIETEFLTKSTAYRIKQNCQAYLRRIGLDIKKNCIIGEEYRIRFLIALLHYKYGIDCYEMNDADTDIIHNFILSTNETIDRSFLEMTTNEYGFFNYLLFLSWKRQSYLHSPIISKHLDLCKKLFAYELLKESIRKNLEPNLNIVFSENDFNYIYLCYCCINNCIFADKWTEKDIKQLHELTFSDKIFSDLLQRLEHKFGKEISASHVVRTTLIYFYRKSLLGLQCITPDKNLYLDAKRSPLTQVIFENIAQIIEDWRIANHIKYEIDKSHLFYLSLQIELILKHFMKPPPVFILSELPSELEVITLYLDKIFPPNRVTLHSFLISAENKDAICSQKQSVMIVNRKFKYMVEDWKLAEHNTVVPITVELNSRDLISVQKAIMYYETENLLDFVRRI
ncbi:helix-turn-helix domain-containing protein [Faecalimonas sp.]|nr:helix-turn-helix domain-containing protein [Lachnospiraceae bacterium]